MMTALNKANVLESEQHMWGVGFVHTPHMLPFSYWQLLFSVASMIEMDSKDK